MTKVFVDYGASSDKKYEPTFYEMKNLRGGKDKIITINANDSNYKRYKQMQPKELLKLCTKSERY